MKMCTQCNKENPDDFKYCRYCGNDLISTKSVKPFLKKLPAWAWIIIGLAAIGLFIGSITMLFVGIATVAGLASIILLIAGILVFGVFSGFAPQNSKLFRAIALGFFALMGSCIDQTGNFFYNKPIEWCFCEDGSSLTLSENISNPYPGTTYIQQDFTCYNNKNEPIKTVNIFVVFGIRFIEYLLLGYVFIGCKWLFFRYRKGNV